MWRYNAHLMITVEIFFIKQMERNEGCGKLKMQNLIFEDYSTDEKTRNRAGNDKKLDFFFLNVEMNFTSE